MKYTGIHCQFGKKFAMSIACSVCGRRLKGDEKFCPACGRRLNTKPECVAIDEVVRLLNNEIWKEKVPEPGCASDVSITDPLPNESIGRGVGDICSFGHKAPDSCGFCRGGYCTQAICTSMPPQYKRCEIIKDDSLPEFKSCFEVDIGKK